MTNRPSTSERISANVRAIASRRKMQVQSLAHRCDSISLSAMYRLWRGEQKWTAEQIEEVAAALGVDWDRLTATHQDEQVPA